MLALEGVLIITVDDAKTVTPNAEAPKVFFKTVIPLLASFQRKFSHRFDRIKDKRSLYPSSIRIATGCANPRKLAKKPEDSEQHHVTYRDKTVNYIYPRSLTGQVPHSSELT